MIASNREEKNKSTNLRTNANNKTFNNSEKLYLSLS